MKNSALSVGALVLLSRGTALAEDPKSSDDKNYRVWRWSFRITIWKDGTGWTTSENDADIDNGGGDLGTHDNPTDLINGDGPGKPTLTQGSPPNEISEELTSKPFDVRYEKKKPINPTQYKFVRNGNPSTITKPVTGGFKKGWEYTFTVTVTAWN